LIHFYKRIFVFGQSRVFPEDQRQVEGGHHGGRSHEDLR
jgi:hypothetical protein